MARRKRHHIPLVELLASALADKLPPAERDALRSARVAALQVVRMFTPDHIKLHAFGGEDKWWNLDMRRRDADLKAKDAADTSRAAKAVRIDTANAEHVRRLLLKHKPKRQRSASKWPRQRFAARRKPWGR
jgi:hypothetical protein